MATVSNIYKDCVFDERLYSWGDVLGLEGELRGLGELIDAGWKGGDARDVAGSVDDLGSKVRQAGAVTHQRFDLAYSREDWFVEEGSWQAEWVPR